MKQDFRRGCILFLMVTILFSSASCIGKTVDIPPLEGGYDENGNYHPGIPDVASALEEAEKQNTDVVGWLNVPNTVINEPVVQTRDNEYYLRRDYKKNYSYEGSYYMDYESVLFDDGADLAQNTIIYGHNLGNPMGVKDDPEGAKFAQLLKFNDEEFARKTPYIYLITKGAPHIFEVFAAAYCEAATTPIPYHYAEYNDENFQALVADFKSRSEFLYDVDVKPGDILLTLSTCSYRDGTYSQNPNQRYVVMARQVRDGETFREEAQIKPNPNIKAPQYR